MGWDGDDLAGQMEELFERQQAAADARANRGTSSVEERARSAKFESLRLSRLQNERDRAEAMRVHPAGGGLGRELAFPTPKRKATGAE